MTRGGASRATRTKDDVGGQAESTKRCHRRRVSTGRGRRLTPTRSRSESSLVRETQTMRAVTDTP